ncbi:DUF4389 domain-containing protein [Methylovulum psychrotolerans]|jgi:hypothetical protein|uniref:Lipase n=1 Tax=Methylovulum psychrotolerans TaxID=1704499 RepID=A0A1Z4BTN8_9GAMM|nr:DUF4389 domain-containing protein [Methylovulum psychrotolerans]ASF44665.1 lipase [Methylovulum psychrotolerans]MBT9098783.1 DUF4389 domain-containing protein [Methylovulum psychrotolerans]POZ52639.1 hypothetical protein AADEFJLK_01243 [Methylovulum psychrotolerans]
MDEQINSNLKQLSTWKRIFFMLIFAVIGELIRLLVWTVVILQVASSLLTGKPNPNVLSFGRSLSLYSYHILLFLTFSTEIVPFPFSDWNSTTALQLADTEATKD